MAQSAGGCALDLAVINVDGLVTGRSTDSGGVVLDVSSGSYAWINQRGERQVHRCKFAQHCHLKKLRELAALHNTHVDRPYVCSSLHSIADGSIRVRARLLSRSRVRGLWDYSD
eukprot:SAG11_NODE_3171_length_2636_cov_1.373670_3_plen_114_part_00